MGPHKRFREEPRLTVFPPTVAGSEHGNVNSRVAAGMEPSCTKHQHPLYSQNTTTYGIPASLRTGLRLHRPTTTNGSTKGIQEPHIRHIANPTQREARTGGDASHTPMANTDWTTVWRNLQDTPVTDETKVIWYRIIHGIIPTHERLHRIRMTPTETYRQCNTTDTL